MKLKRILIIMLCLLITGCKANETEANDKLDMQYKNIHKNLLNNVNLVMEVTSFQLD